jgi:PTS system beta-glucosides-specific IIC component
VPEPPAPEADPADQAGTTGGGTTTLTRTTPLEVSTPVAGRVVALADVPDRIFSSGVLGRGVGVVPSVGQVFAPVDGTVASAMPHAYGIVTDSGAELLIHVGIDTVQLDGAHFTQRVGPGEPVRRGDLLTEVDLDAVRAAGFDPVTVLIVTAAARYDLVAVTTEPEVGLGQTLLTLTASADGS